MPFPIDFSRTSATDAERILSTIRQWSASIPPGDYPALPSNALEIYNFSTTNEAVLSAELLARLRACACNVFATAMDAIQKRRRPTNDEFSAVIRLHRYFLKKCKRILIDFFRSILVLNYSCVIHKYHDDEGSDTY
jgi:hypothetical protein